MLVEVVPPFCADCHRLYRSTFALSREPLFLGVRNHPLDILRVNRVEDREEVFAIRVSVSRIAILQILHHFDISFELWKDVLHTELIVHGHVDRAFLTDLEQFLVALKHSSDEVSVHGCHWGHIQLNCISIIRGFQILLTLLAEVVMEVLF